MQDKHTEFSALMVVALVLVAASAIVQTAFGLQDDARNAALARRALGAVAAADGNSSNPVVQRYTNQFYAIHVEQDGHAQILGKITAKDGMKLTVQTWGSSWNVTIDKPDFMAGNIPSDNVAQLATIPAMQIGDFVVVQGKATDLASNQLSAGLVYDITLNGPHIPRSSKGPISLPPVSPIASGTLPVASGTPAQPSVVGEPVTVSQDALPSPQRASEEMSRLQDIIKNAPTGTFDSPEVKAEINTRVMELRAAMRANGAQPAAAPTAPSAAGQTQIQTTARPSMSATAQ